MGILAVGVRMLWRRWIRTRRMWMLGVGIMMRGWWVVVKILVAWSGTRRGRITTALGSDTRRRGRMNGMAMAVHGWYWVLVLVWAMGGRSRIVVSICKVWWRRMVLVVARRSRVRIWRQGRRHIHES
jgi:hypothetical protein